MQDALGPESPPLYEIVPFTYANGSPKEVTVRAIRRGGENYSEVQVYNLISAAIRRGTMEALTTWRPNMSLETMRNIQGILQMNNIAGDQHAHTEIMTINQLGAEAINELFDRARVAGSNPDLGIYDVEFNFWINPASLVIGGARTSCGKTDGIYKKTMRTPGDVGCMASSLVFALSKQGFYSSAEEQRIRKRDKSWLEASLKLQSDMDWDDETPLTSLKTFVDTYPEWRVVILQRVFSHHTPVEIFAGEGFSKTIYLGYNIKDRHIMAISSAREYMKKGGGDRWCDVCMTIQQSLVCKCGKLPYKPRKMKNCESCGVPFFNARDHQCDAQQCNSCHLFFEKNEFTTHRCPIYRGRGMAKMPGAFLGEDEDDYDTDFHKDSEYNLFVYDLESCLVPMEGPEIPYYEVDERGYFKLNAKGEIIRTVTRVKNMQVPNLVVWKNVFDGSEIRHSSSLKEFIEAMLYENDGKNIVLAHNGSGYDTRLLFEEMMKILPNDIQLNPLLRGTKFLRLAVGKTVFMDSMMHLTGSLSGLADSYLKGTDYDLEKGDFPHLFNRAENMNYRGPLPPDSAWDMTFSVKDDKALARHQRMRESWEGKIWDCEKELLNYCKNDVEILAEVVRLHHVQCIQMIKDHRPELVFSPWHSTTAAGFMHKLFLHEVHFDAERFDAMDEHDLAQEAESSWAALLAEEYYFFKKGFRGGRTEVRKFLYEGPVKCFDVHSMYPSIQIGKKITVMGKDIPLLFPVGVPEIKVFDPDYYPCNKHFENPRGDCCPVLLRKKYVKRKLRIEEVTRQPDDIHAFIRDNHGAFMVDVTPPTDLYHPVLPYYSEEKKKCIFSLEPMVAQVFYSPMLRVAIDVGYTVTKLYRADLYEMAESKWKGFLGSFYKIKYYSSMENVPLEKQIRHKKYYKEEFDLDLDFTKCSKRPAMKTSSKILINSPWGKHAESVDHDETKVHGIMDDESFLFYQKILNKQLEVSQTVSLPERTLFKVKCARNEDIRPNLHKGYLPCAGMVPMYGQLMLWNVLHQLGERVLMCDTDSVKYFDTGKPGEYQVPEGDCLGMWENEGDLTGFVSFGLKCYGLKYADGKEVLKLKGCNLKRAHGEMMNFEVMKKMLLKKEIVDIPQLVFQYIMGQGIFTMHSLKTVKFDPNILKGDYDPESKQLFPYGFVRK